MPRQSSIIVPGKKQTNAGEPVPRVVISIGDKVVGARALSKEKPVVMGRGKDVDLLIPNLSVSRRHAKVYHRNGAWFFEDMGSTNGSYADGERVTVFMLTNGKQVQIGKALLRFEAAENQDLIVQAAYRMNIGDILKTDGPRAPDLSPLERENDTVFVKLTSVMPKADLPAAAPPMPPHLEYAGTAPPRRVPLDKDRLTLGKGENDDVKVEGMLISAGHAAVEKRPDGSWHLVARKKFPAVSVNGIKVTEHRLKWDDYIDLGNTRLWFRKGR
jgi:hypothetical protein